jgi:hypothetical protein
MKVIINMYTKILITICSGYVKVSKSVLMIYNVNLSGTRMTLIPPKIAFIKFSGHPFCAQNLISEINIQ